MTLLLNGVPHFVCQGCDAVVNAHTQDTLPDEGLIVTLRGYYGGFTDTMPGEEPQELILCHDCSLAVWRAIPVLRDIRGLHSTVSDGACCEFQWTFGQDESGEIETIIYGDGTSKPIEKR